MSQRNDDINHLFAHLGLNPGDYQEVNQPASAPVEPSPPPAAPAANPPAATVITLSPSARAPSMVFTPAQAPMPAAEPAPPPAATVPSPAARSWPLLNAVTQTPPKVARIESVRRPPTVVAPEPQPLPDVVQAPPPTVADLPTAALAAEPAADETPPLIDTFRRLIAPAPVTAPSGHLRLRYGEQQPGRSVAEEREQTLEEVFARITDLQRPRPS